MASPVGSLVVRIGADLTELQKGVQKAQGHLSKLGAGMRTGINIAGKYAAAMAAAGAAVAAALITKAMQAIDAQAKLARQVGTTTAGLQAIQRAADLAGVSSQLLTSGLNAMTRRLGQAAHGTGEAKKTLDQLGLSAERLIQLDASDAFAEISEEISKLPTAAERSAAAMQIFSDAGRNMVNLFAGGREALDAARAEIEALGVAVSDVDASTIERANDAMSSLREVFRGAINRVTVQLAPLIEGIANALRSAAIESRGFESQINTAFSGAMKAAGFFADMVQGIRVVFKGVELIATGFGATVVSVFELATKVVLSFVDGVNQNINAVISGLNKIPQVDIPLLEQDFRNSAFMQGLHALGDEARNKVGEVRGELHDLAMQEMPSDKIQRFLAEVTEASRAASEAAAQARSELMVGGAEGEDEAESEEVDKQRESLQRKLDALREYMMSEAELEAVRHEERLLTLQEALEAELTTEREYKAAREQLEQEHQDRLTAIEQAGLSERQKFQQMSSKDKVKTVSGELADISSGVAQHNKAMFRLNQAAGISNAIINAYEGISKTLSAYPYPINIGMAAAHGVAAFAQVNAIRSQSFGSGGGAAPSLAGGTPATPVTPVQSGTAAPTSRLAVEGVSPDSLFSGRMVRELAERLQDHVKDGGEVVFV